MSKRKSAGVVGRLGARYGRTVRGRVDKIEAEMRRKHLCPSCNSMKVERASVGVWRCAKCGATFAGAAYAPSSRVGEIVKRNVKREA